MNDAQRIYELMILTAWADGKIEPSEVLAIQRLVAAQPAFAAIAGRGEITRTIKERIDRLGLEAVVRETASAIEARGDREIAFRCCAHVLGADGELQGEEADVLGTLQELFSFSTADVKRLLAER